MIEFYTNTNENIPPSIPESKGNSMSTSVLKDTYLVSDTLAR